MERGRERPADSDALDSIVMTPPSAVSVLLEGGRALASTSSWNWNNFYEVSAGTVIGALFAFFGTAVLRSLDRKATKTRETRHAVIDFISWVNTTGRDARTHLDAYEHFEASHPDNVVTEFPQGKPKIDPMREYAELEKLDLSSYGVVREMVMDLKQSSLDISRNDYVAIHFPAFSDTASAVLSKRMKTKRAARRHYEELKGAMETYYVNRHVECTFCHPERRVNGEDRYYGKQ